MTLFARIASRLSPVLFLFVFQVMPANASDNAVLTGMEFFSWQEFDYGGQRLLSEHGLRYVLSVENEGFIPNIANVSYRLSWRGYTGDVDYDGQTNAPKDPANDRIFAATTTTYTGWGLEATIRYHISAHHNVQPALAASAGFDSWSRNLKSTIDAKGNPVGSATEDYEILYGRFGAQLKRPGKIWTGTLDVGVKYPCKTNENVSGLQPTLTPGKQLSPYMNYHVDWHNDYNSRFFVNLAYDGYRFSASPEIPIDASTTVHQPASHQNIFSLMIGTSF